MGSHREKSNIAIAILEKLPFSKGTKIISHFDGSNNIFVDCTYNNILQTEACPAFFHSGQIPF